MGLAGCVSNPERVGELGEASGLKETGSSGDTDQWTLRGSVTPGFLAAAGIPFRDVTVVEGCDVVTFSVPPNSSLLTVRLYGEPVNASRPGAGYMTFMMRHRSERWDPPIDVQPREKTERKVEDPAPGVWEAWVWPTGPVVNQEWTLEIVVQGTGPSPPELELELGGFSCPAQA